MQTPASVAKHPLHPMLVVFPIGLWIFSLVCDLVSLAVSDPDVAGTWSLVAFFTMAGGLVGALAAAVPGFIDLLSIADPDVRKIALTHMAINLTAVVIYAANLWLRLNGMETGLPIGLSVLTVLMLGVSGWLGGEMVHVHGVGVQPVPGDRRRRNAPPEALGIVERRMARHGVEPS
ncbi:MAG TPA: DUF2231 domain-containing protein [Rhodocyclaceae bacterium]